LQSGLILGAVGIAWHLVPLWVVHWAPAAAPRSLAGFRIAGRRGLVQLAVGLGLVGLAIWGALPIIMPVFTSSIRTRTLFAS